MRIAPPNAALLEQLVPFVVATPEVQAGLELRPFGLEIAAAHRFDPLRTGSSEMLNRLRSLDEATFGSAGMAMPRWVLLDGAGLSGAIIGLAAPAAGVDAPVRELLGLPPSPEGLIPYSMYIAIPSFEPETWVGHNLASLAACGPPDRSLHGLGSLTKAIALCALRAKCQLGAAQWDSIALRVHVRLGALALLTAWTPAHSKPWTFTYAARIDDTRLRHLARDPQGRIEMPDPERRLRSDDHAAMQALQRRIEAGERWYIVGPPEKTEHGASEVPLATAEAPARGLRA